MAAFAPLALATEPPPPAADARTTQQAALQGLVDGNARFVDGKQAPHVLGAERPREQARGQHPQAVVLSCSDSRVPPEYVFDQQLGQVFVVRTAGNVADVLRLVMPAVVQAEKARAPDFRSAALSAVAVSGPERGTSWPSSRPR